MIFISHAHDDADFVRDLRVQLESLGLETWVDCRELVAGNKLATEIERAIDRACHLLVVISPSTVNSNWVRKEINYALAKQKQNPEFRIIPLLLPGIKPAALSNWFDEEPLAVPLEIKPAGLLEAMPAILAALGKEAPDHPEKITEPTQQPLEELVLALEEPQIKQLESGARQLSAKAKLIYQPADKNKREQNSRPFRFTAPLGDIELYDIRWYLEDYQIWPAGEFKKRAEAIANNLPRWGQALYQAALNHETAQELAKTWRSAKGQRRFSVLIDDAALDDSEKTQPLAATNALWALPWELLHDVKAISPKASKAAGYAGVCRTARTSSLLS